MKDFNSIDEIRELGKTLFFRGKDEQQKELGLSMLIRAKEQRDPEAMYIIARLLLDGLLKTKGNDTAQYALELLCVSANRGFMLARAFLDSYCEERYRLGYSGEFRDPPKGSLVDFDGKIIKIDRKGLLTPVDAVLEYKDGRNVLTLSVNVRIWNNGACIDEDAFMTAVRNGLLEWQGEYEVFGGQKLSVRVEVTDKAKLIDNIYIMPVDEDTKEIMKNYILTVGKGDRRKLDIIENDRSCSGVGVRKWSVTSRKIICIMSDDCRFEDYEEIKHIVKHEFGHVLGLGDLYASAADSYSGVKKGTYPELDGYAINEKVYNLVMCDHHGPVSNNDIEMVVLAFRENRMQLYQPHKIFGKLSDALGRGN